MRWFEIVQDMDQGDKWHVNLFFGPKCGDLAAAVLVKHEVLESDGLSLEGLGLPWRVQYRDGTQQQSF